MPAAIRNGIYALVIFLIVTSVAVLVIDINFDDTPGCNDALHRIAGCQTGNANPLIGKKH